MNAHQRRKASRSRHMLLPLGKEVRIGALLGREVYAYGSLSCSIVIEHSDLAKIETAQVHRHINPQGGGQVDLRLTAIDGREHVIRTSMRGIHLKNPKDRAPRPWWATLRRRMEGGTHG